MSFTICKLVYTDFGPAYLSNIGGVFDHESGLSAGFRHVIKNAELVDAGFSQCVPVSVPHMMSHFSAELEHVRQHGSSAVLILIEGLSMERALRFITAEIDLLRKGPTGARARRTLARVFKRCFAKAKVG